MTLLLGISDGTSIGIGICIGIGFILTKVFNRNQTASLNILPGATFSIQW